MKEIILWASNKQPESSKIKKTILKKVYAYPKRDHCRGGILHLKSLLYCLNVNLRMEKKGKHQVSPEKKPAHGSNHDLLTWIHFIHSSPLNRFLAIPTTVDILGSESSSVRYLLSYQQTKPNNVTAHSISDRKE